MPSRYEASILYDRKHQPLLETYAESMGWTVEVVFPSKKSDDLFMLSHCVLCNSNRKEEHILEDTLHAIRSFEEDGATPLSFTIMRVVFDQAAGIDELTEEDDD